MEGGDPWNAENQWIKGERGEREGLRQRFKNGKCFLRGGVHYVMVMYAYMLVDVVVLGCWASNARVFVFVFSFVLSIVCKMS